MNPQLQAQIQEIASNGNSAAEVALAQAIIALAPGAPVVAPVAPAPAPVTSTS